MRLRTKVTLFFGLIALDRHRVADRRDLRLRPLLAARPAHRGGPPAGRAATPSGSATSCAAARTSFGDCFTTVRTERGGFAAVRPQRRASRPAPTPSSPYDELPRRPAPGRRRRRVGRAALQLGDDHYVGVGIHIAEVDADYFEAFPLGPTERTLRTILLALVIGIADHGPAGHRRRAGGRAGRLLRPLGRITDAAGEIAAGDLDTRVAREGDPDLDRLADSFNDMADAVQARIEREARFASDVSHELRSPITALAAAAEVIDGRRGELPDRTQQALDVVVGQVRRFDAMVIDLLELSRIDAGATDLHTEEVDIADAVPAHRRPQRLRRPARSTSRTTSATARRSTAVVDKLRFERILANLLENADHHGGGPLRISIEPTDGPFLLVAVEDAGPGVARGERVRIFERFARGSAARHRIGTGLGLALVAEHATAQGGEAWVEDRPGGGARFVVRIREGAGPMNRLVLAAVGAVMVLVVVAHVVRRRPATAELQQIDSADLFGLDDDDHVDDDHHDDRPDDGDADRRRSHRRSATTTTTIATEPVELYFVDGTRWPPVPSTWSPAPSPSRVVAALLAGPAGWARRHRAALDAARRTSSTPSSSPAPASSPSTCAERRVPAHRPDRPAGRRSPRSC